MQKERRNVTWRVAEHSENKKLNQWLDSQKNIQDSIANIVLHMIDRFGNVNITDYEVQKQLYGKIVDVSQPMEEEVKKSVNPPSSNENNQSDKLQKQEKKVNDDLYSSINTDNL